MWQHEIIETVERNTTRVWHVTGKQGRKNLKSMTEAFGDENTHTFFMGKMSSIDIKLDESDTKFGPLPYSDMILEYEMDFEPRKGDARCPRRAIVIHAWEDEIGIFPVCLYSALKSWLVEPVFAFIKTKDGDFTTGNLEDLEFGFSWEGVLDNTRKDESPTRLRQDLEADCMAEVIAATKFLKIINARNIVFKTVTPPEHLNRARIRHHQEPVRKYKILEVMKGVVRQKDGGTVEWGYRPPVQTALHMCRGHFKTYSEDAPLFGKYTGTFWWQASVRGNADNGEIVKDYSVRVATAGA